MVVLRKLAHSSKYCTYLRWQVAGARFNLSAAVTQTLVFSAKEVSCRSWQ